MAEELITSREEEDEELNGSETVASSRTSVVYNNNREKRMNFFKESRQKTNIQIKFVQFLARVVMPIFTIIFTFVYIIVCVYNYKNPVLEYDLE